MTRIVEAWITPVMIGGLMLFMGFIIWDLARRSRAGWLGTVMLFVVLGAGLGAFLVKTVIAGLIEGVGP